MLCLLKKEVETKPVNFFNVIYRLKELLATGLFRQMLQVFSFILPLLTV